MATAERISAEKDILTKSTKSRLEELEATKEDLKIKIANEKISKPKISKEYMTFWLYRFRKLNVSQKSHRKMLIDTFVNAIYLYDDKMLLTFNFKDGTKAITFDDVNDAPSKYGNGSDLDWRTAPIAYFVSYKRRRLSVSSFYVMPSLTKFCLGV